MSDKEKQRAAHKRYREAHPEKVYARLKAWLKTHAEKMRAYRRTYYKAHPEKPHAYGKAYRQTHREEINARNKAWRKANPEKVRAAHKAYSETHREQTRTHKIKYEYNLSLNEYNALLFYQGNACAICREPFTKTPMVDHDHKTGKVRGLLCFGCNHGLGHFKDDPCRLRLAAEYLERKKDEQKS